MLRSLYSPSSSGRHSLTRSLRATALLPLFSLVACGYLGLDAGDGVVLGGDAGALVDDVHGDGGDSSSDGGSSGGKGPGSGGKGDEGHSGGDGSGGATATGGASPGSGGNEASGGGDGTGGAAASGGADSGTGGVDGSGGESASDGGSGGSLGTGGVAGTGGSDNDCGDDSSVCGALADALVHRYSFDGLGPSVRDSVGVAHGHARGTNLTGNGQLEFSGMGAFVDLPRGIVSALTNASFEIWFRWHGGPHWQRLFDFGAHDMPQNPVNYLYLTPQAGGTILPEIALGAGLRHLVGGDRQLRTTAITQPHVWTHVVLVVDDDADQLSLFKDGQWVAARDMEVRLPQLRDDVNRLGRSLFPEDPYFDGEITEFRIYSARLTEEQIEASFVLGPDVVLSVSQMPSP